MFDVGISRDSLRKREVVENDSISRISILIQYIEVD